MQFTSFSRLELAAQVAQAMAVAVLLNRTLILPLLTCFCDYSKCANISIRPIAL